MEAIHYYSSLFDSLDMNYGAIYNEDSIERHAVEQQLFVVEDPQPVGRGQGAAGADVSNAARTSVLVVMACLQLKGNGAQSDLTSTLAIFITINIMTKTSNMASIEYS